jgi:colicin import membrane protein
LEREWRAPSGAAAPDDTAASVAARASAAGYDVASIRPGLIGAPPPPSGARVVEFSIVALAVSCAIHAAALVAILVWPPARPPPLERLDAIPVEIVIDSEPAEASAAPLREATAAPTPPAQESSPPDLAQATPAPSAAEPRPEPVAPPPAPAEPPTTSAHAPPESALALTPRPEEPTPQAPTAVSPPAQQPPAATSPPPPPAASAPESASRPEETTPSAPAAAAQPAEPPPGVARPPPASKPPPIVAATTPRPVQPARTPADARKSSGARPRTQPATRNPATLESVASKESSPKSSAAQLAEYGSAVEARISAVKRYPEAARARAPHGVAIVRFTIEASGQVAGAQISQSAGDADLDAEALATVRRASPFPPPPPGAPRAFSAQLNFRVR